MSYCSSLTNEQVRNVYIIESQRMSGLSSQSKVYQGAKDLRQEAKEELLRRNLSIPEDY